MSTTESSGSYTPPPPPPPPGGMYPPSGASGLPPGDVGSMKTFFLVSLIVNAVATLIWIVSALGAGIATCGIGCVLIVIPIVSGVAIVLDSMALSKMGQAPSPATHGFLKTAAILDIVSGVVSVGVIPLVMGILCLINLGKPDVQRYYGVA